MRFFIDNCLAPRLAPVLELLSEDGAKVVHLRSRFPQDVKDIDWLGALGGEGNCVILSGDMRITKLPQERAAWQSSGLTSFFFAKGWMHFPLHDQAWRLVRWWPRIQEQAALILPGAGFIVPINFGDKGKFEQVPAVR